MHQPTSSKQPFFLPPPLSQFTSNELNQELAQFIAGVNRQGSTRNPELARSAIYLLKHMPAAHDAVLEYMHNLFDEAVHNYILKLELQDKGTVAGNVATDENTIKEVVQVLLQFIKEKPATWASRISAWSLELLGHLSSKYADRYVTSSISNLHQILQFWMDCYPTKALMELTTSCLSTLIDSNPDSCINALLETSVQRSPHFDWVVAHIGSSFPTTVITRVLACGLKDFTPDDGSSTSSKRVSSKLASVVGILGHLIAHHSHNIREALLSLFYSSFGDNETKEQLSTIPYLLHLASLSDMLADVCTAEFTDTVNIDILNKLSLQFSLWKKSNIPGTEDLVKVVLHLLLKCEAGGRAIHKLLDLATNNHSQCSSLDPTIKRAAGLVLDHVLKELQIRVFGGNLDIPLLRYFSTNTMQLIETLQNTTDLTRAGWVLHVLKLICIHSGEGTSVSVIGQLFFHIDEVSFTHQLLNQLELCQPDILTKCVTFQLAELRVTHSSNAVRLLSHLIEFGKLDPKALTQALQKSIAVLSDQLVAIDDTNAADKAIELLDLCIIPETIPLDILYKVSASVVVYICQILGSHRRHPLLLPHCLKFSQNVLKTLSQQSAAQQQVLRMLLTEVQSERFAKYFGSTFVKLKENFSRPKQKSLQLENYNNTTSIVLPQSHSSVFHAGIIGNGLRSVPVIENLSQEEIVFNKEAILNILQFCCGSSWRFPSNKPEKPDKVSNKLNGDIESLVPGMKIVALLLVELVSPDVMFNGLPWPEEDFQKVTIERDLFIRCKFEDHPILWDLLLLIASVPPSLCYCSVLLRALMALMMSYWSSCQHRKTTSSPRQLELTQNLLNVMALGQILPPPLCYVGEVIPHLSPFETHCILTDMWQFMKDNVPSPAFFTLDPNTGMLWRESTRCESQYTDRLQHILINNIAHCDYIYAKMFPQAIST